LDELYDLIARVDDEQLAGILDEIYKETESDSVEDSVDWDKMLTHVLNHPQSRRLQRRDNLFTVKRLAIAASVLVFLAWSFFYLLNGLYKNTEDSIVASEIDVQAPTGNRSYITLENGTVIVLDSLGQGGLAQDGNMRIVRSGPGQISYLPIGEDETLRYNTITNPRGSRVVDVTLSDGSRVWLNAGSSLRFPVAFIGKERNVEMTGEGYFEVAHDNKRTFHVKKGDMVVEVLGTKFNVNAYEDEPDIKVTLLEGSVSVSNDNENRLLRPAQQARILGDKIEINKNVHIESVLAWKEGLFFFSGATLQEVMSHIARWYDLDVMYEGKMTGKRFGGKIFKDASLSEVMKILEASGVHYELKNQKTIVIKEK